MVEYYDTYGTDKTGVDHSTLANRIVLLVEGYEAIDPNSIEQMLNYIDFSNHSLHGPVNDNYQWDQFDATARSYWQGLFSVLEGTESSEEFVDAIYAYGNTNGFPQNRPYSTALNVLLHTNEFWDTQYQDGIWENLKRGSQIAIADGVHSRR